MYQDNKKNISQEEHSINEINVINKDVKNFSLYRTDNSKSTSNETNDCESNINKIYRKDAKGENIIKRDENNKKLKHHVHFIDEVDKSKKLEIVTEVKSYKDYNKKVAFNSIYEETFRMQIVDHSCCCIIV